MVMSWSYTVEGIENARNNLAKIPYGTLWQIWAEIQTFLEMCDRENVDPAMVVCPDNYWDEDVYSTFLSRPIRDRDILENSIWDYAENSLRECSNDFFKIHLCPYGCHTVKVD